MSYGITMSQAMRLWQTFDANADGGISREANCDYIHHLFLGNPYDKVIHGDTVNGPMLLLLLLLF